MMDVQSIRVRSIKRASERGVVVPSNLPFLDVDIQLRKRPDIVNRLLALNVVAATAYGFDRRRAVKWLDRECLNDAVAASERAFLEHGVGDPRAFQVQVEGLWALAWAVELVSGLDYFRDCNPNFVTLLPNLKLDAPSAPIRTNAKLRSIEDIAAECDLGYCLHWAIRQSAINRKLPPAVLKEYLVVERRRSLEWLLSDDDWDAISLDT
jgi:hypothetical protein